MAAAHRLLVTALGAIACASAAVDVVAEVVPRTVVVSIATPNGLAGNYLGRVPGESVPDKEFSVALFRSDVRSSTGNEDSEVEDCSSGPKDFPAGRVAILNASNCSLAQQVGRARKAGASGVLLIAMNQSIDFLWANSSSGDAGEVLAAAPSDFAIIGVQRRVGDKWLESETEIEDIRMSVELYKPAGIFDVSQLCLLLLATSLVAAGAFFATADLRLGSPLAPKQGEVFEVDAYAPLKFFAMGSAALVTLYLLMKYLIYFIILMFCVGGTNALTEIMFRTLRYRFPSLQRPLCSVPLVGAVEMAFMISLPIAASIAISWFILRNTDHGWLFQDIIGAGFLCFIQRTLRLPNGKLAAGFLSLMVFFDVFWVFISPLLFEKSVMVVVATGGGTGEAVPMLLRLPAIGDPLGRDRMLGFGDVALPGLLLSYLRRHDILSCRGIFGGYFTPAMVGYILGLCATLVALHIMQMGQPALLYLVPGTLGTTLLVAWRRGELAALWEGRPCEANGAGGKCTGPMCVYCPGGHLLKLWGAEKGHCDGCRKEVVAGEQVMDCRICNWYLCVNCRPLKLQTPSVTVDMQDLERSLVTAS